METQSSVPPLIDIGLSKENLPQIFEDQMLVPKDFQYEPKEIEEEVVRALNDGPRFETYPEHGLRMSETEFDDWEKAGRPKEALVGTLENRPVYFLEKHPNRNNPDGSLKNTRIQVYDGTQQFPPGTFPAYLNTASDGTPLHPFLKAAITSSNGIPTGCGFYWKLGENQAADPVIARVRDGRLEILLIQRSDGGGWALPGGMIDEKDPALSKSKAMGAIETAIDAAEREAGEETGITNLHDVPRVEILKNVPVGDWRLTAQAWPVTSVYLFIPNQAASEAMVPKGADDAKEAVFKSIGGEIKWEGAESQLLFASHTNYVKLAIKKWQELTGLVVRKDGVVGIAA